MKPFTTLTGVAAPLDIMNVDTDMIIPKQYLKTIKRTGLGSGLFAELRFNEDGSEMYVEWSDEATEGLESAVNDFKRTYGKDPYGVE